MTPQEARELPSICERIGAQHEWRLLYVTPSKVFAKFYCIHCLKQTKIKVEHDT